MKQTYKGTTALKSPPPTTAFGYCTSKLVSARKVGPKKYRTSQVTNQRHNSSSRIITRKNLPSLKIDISNILKKELNRHGLKLHSSHHQKSQTSLSILDHSPQSLLRTTLCRSTIEFYSSTKTKKEISTSVDRKVVDSVSENSVQKNRTNGDTERLLRENINLRTKLRDQRDQVTRLEYEKTKLAEELKVSNARYESVIDDLSQILQILQTGQKPVQEELKQPNVPIITKELETLQEINPTSIGKIKDMLNCIITSSTKTSDTMIEYQQNEI